MENRTRYQITAAELAKKDIKGTQWIVEGLLPEGMAILASPPKVGKTFMCMQMADAVSNGGMFLGRKATHGAVLYYALEDNESRIKARLKMIGAEPSDKLIFELDAPKMSGGLIDDLYDTLKEHPDLKLVVIDVLSLVRDPMISTMDAYNSDYTQMEHIQKFAVQNHLCVLLVTHLNKQASFVGVNNVEGDPFSAISGSTAIVGAADTVMLIAGKEPNFRLLISGRDVKSRDIPLKLNKETNAWNAFQVSSRNLPCQIDEKKYMKSPVRSAILELVDSYKGAIEIPNDELCRFIQERGVHMDFNTIRSVISSMIQPLKTVDHIEVENIYFENLPYPHNRGLSFKKVS